MENSTYFRTDLTETTEFTLEQARNAGVQRLLEDAGIYSDEIDGDVGPVTQYAIREFLASNQLDASTSDDDLLDMLEQVAQQRALNVGMQVCNRTEHKIWAAIASRKGDGWESRGWWGLEAGGCARVIDKLLQETRYFVLGEIETDSGVRRLRRATDNFCVGRARFAINGRENCESRAFRTAPFVNIPTPESRQLVYEFFERDFTDPEPR